MTDVTPSKASLSNEAEVPIKSPCISVCALDNEGMCTGCFRTGDEIRGWGTYTNTERREVLVQVHEREKRVNPFL